MSEQLYRWVKASERLPEFLQEVTVRFNNLDASVGWFQSHKDWETGEESIYFRSKNEENEDVWIDSTPIEWLDETTENDKAKDEVDELKERCISWAKQHDENKSTIQSLQQQLKAKDEEISSLSRQVISLETTNMFQEARLKELEDGLREILELPQTIGHAYQMQDIAKKLLTPKQ